MQIYSIFKHILCMFLSKVWFDTSTYQVLGLVGSRPSKYILLHSTSTDSFWHKGAAVLHWAPFGCLSSPLPTSKDEPTCSNQNELSHYPKLTAVGEGFNKGQPVHWDLCFLTQLLLSHVWYNVCIADSSAPIHLLFKCAILALLMSPTLAYFNSSTCGKNSLPTQREQSTVSWQSTMASRRCWL